MKGIRDYLGRPAWQVLGSSGRKRERAHARETRVSPSRAPVFFCVHYFQVPATQANLGKDMQRGLMMWSLPPVTWGNKRGEKCVPQAIPAN